MIDRWTLMSDPIFLWGIRLGGLDSQRSAMVNIDNLVLSACGTSLFASEYGALLMRYLHSVETCTVIDAAECGFDSFPRSKAGLCVLSQSGETKDVIRVLNKAQEAGKEHTCCLKITSLLRTSYIISKFMLEMFGSKPLWTARWGWICTQLSISCALFFLRIMTLIRHALQSFDVVQAPDALNIIFEAVE